MLIVLKFDMSNSFGMNFDKIKTAEVHSAVEILLHS